MTNAATAIQPTPHGKGAAIAALVCQDIQARNDLGIKKYGEALRAFNGRDPLVDLYQELLDGAQYIRQELEERKGNEVQARLSAHTDDVAVDRFAVAMKAKLAKKRAEGRGGWDDPAQCHVDDLAEMLINHIPKGDPVDVANFAMMLHQRGAGKVVLALNSVYFQQQANRGSISLLRRVCAYIESKEDARTFSDKTAGKVLYRAILEQISTLEAGKP